MHLVGFIIAIHYSVFDMFRTSKCSSSGRLVHAVQCYFFHAKIITKPLIIIFIIISERKNYHKTACTNLPEDEHLDVRNMSKTL